MELPHLGQHCSDPFCKRLDFLPVRCDACSKVFCNEHYVYANHQCPEAYRKDNQVPVCPLCNSPVPLGASGELPDVVVGRHIDNDCQSETAQSRRKVYSNKCSLKGCKQKEVVPLTCERCHKNYCLRHRHEMDHDCKGFENTGRAVSNPGAAAIFRSRETVAKEKRSTAPQHSPLTNIGRDLDRDRQQRQQTRVTATQVHSLQQPTLSEDEALRQAMALSLQESQAPTSNPSTDAERRRQEELDEALARALQDSEQEAAGRRRPNPVATQSSNQEKSNCMVS